MVPKDLRYTVTHEWVRQESGLIIICITAHAAEKLSEVIYVELPDPADDVLPDSPFGEIEMIDSTQDLHAPLEGRVVEANTALADAPQMLKKDPYGQAWMIKVRPDKEELFDQLLNAEEYQRLIENE